MKRFYVNVIDERVAAAAKLAESLLVPHSKMMLDLQYRSDWIYEPIILGRDLVDLLTKQREPIPVGLYRPFYWRSKVVGYFDGKKIFINERKLPGMKVTDLAGTLLHEYSHYCGLKHGSNRITRDKLTKSVPYYLSENIESWIV